MKINFIQSFRGIAILLVILGHSSHHKISKDIGILYIDNFIWFGHHGVTLFFLISAFIIFYSLNQNYIDAKRNYIQFLIKRFFRIAPLYYIAILVYHVLLNNNHQIDANLVTNILFINWIHPNYLNSVVPGAWSITTEFTFYYFAPILFRYLTSFKTTLNFFLISILISRILTAILGIIYPDADKLYYILNPLSQFPVFILGILLYFIIIRKEKFTITNSQLILISLILFAEFIAGRNTVIRDHYVAALFFAILVYVISKTNFSNIISKILIFIGELSFTIYISHFLIIILISNYSLLNLQSFVFLGWLERFFLILFGAIILSLPINYFIEKPFIKLGKKISKLI